MGLFRALKYRLMAWMVRRHPGLYLRLRGQHHCDLLLDKEFLEAYAALLLASSNLQSMEDRRNLWLHARATRKLSGDCAELGVFKGESARLIAQCVEGVAVHLFDTFEGLPEVNRATDGDFVTGEFSETSLESVAAYLSGYPNVRFYKGLFPASAEGTAAAAVRYKFVHLDADLYSSTLAGLKFFYPRMVPGGLILCHDYGTFKAPGTKQAFQEFFADKPEIVLRLPGNHCVVAKCS